MRKTLGFVLAAVVIGTAAFTPAATAQTRGMGRINGVVVSESGETLDGVTVRTPTSAGDLLQATSTDKGTWAIGGVGKGEWAVEFVKSGYETRRVRVVVEKETLKPEVIKIVMKRSS